MFQKENKNCIIIIYAVVKVKSVWGLGHSGDNSFKHDINNGYPIYLIF